MNSEEAVTPQQLQFCRGLPARENTALSSALPLCGTGEVTAHPGTKLPKDNKTSQFHSDHVCIRLFPSAPVAAPFLP